MIIQSKKVWFADQFVEAQIEVKDGKIVDIHEYGTALIRMMRKKTDFVTGCAIL